MNSQGRFRRSGSLPPQQSRVSMSRQSIGCGPQRVPTGAAPDSNIPRHSGGSSLKRAGSMSALSHGSIQKHGRMSSVGCATAIKDSRPFSDKLYRERMVRQLVEFLSSHGYSHTIPLKGSNGPSSGDFKKIFEFMVSHLQPDYKLDGKLRLEEEVPRILKAHGYPFTISHSHLRTIGVPSTWVVLLGALSYLRSIIEYSESADIDGILFKPADDEIGCVSKNQLFHEYLENCYKNFLAGNDDEILKIRDRFMEDIENSSLPLADVQALEEEVKHNMDMLVALQSAPNEVSKLTEEVGVLEIDATKMAHYVNDLEKYHANLVTKVAAAEETLNLKVEEKKAVELDIQTKNRILSKQRISGCDAQRINAERRALKAKLALSEKEVQDADRQVEAAQEQFQKEQEAVNVAVTECNSKARLLQLIPQDAECSQGLDLEMRTQLTREESTRYECTVKPALNIISQQRMEKCRQADEELQQAIETRNHFNDVIAQRKEELSSLTSSLASIDLVAANSRQSHVQEVQDLQTAIDEMVADIASRRQPGALAAAQRRLKDLQENYESELARLKAEESEYALGLIEFSKAAVAHKENVKRMLRQKLEMLELADRELDIENEVKRINANK